MPPRAVLCRLCIPLLLLLALGRAAASPGPAVSSAQVGADMLTYLKAERRGGLVLVGLGVPAVAIAGVLLAQDNALMRGVGYPLGAVGVLELGGGILFAGRTNRQIADLSRDLRLRPAHFREAELLRMNRINRQFDLLLPTEVTLLFSGAAMGAAGALNHQQTVAGVGIGLAVHSVVLLIFDHYAARRALRYTESLVRFTP